MDLNTDYKSFLVKKSNKFKAFFLFQWYLSYYVRGDQSDYFEKLRIEAWGRSFNWDSCSNNQCNGRGTQ